MKKIISFVEAGSLCGATGYPLRTPRLEDTVLDAHTRVFVYFQVNNGVLYFLDYEDIYIMALSVLVSM